MSLFEFVHEYVGEEWTEWGTHSNTVDLFVVFAIELEVGFLRADDEKFFNVSFSKSWYSVSTFVYGRFRMMSIVSSVGMFVKRDSKSKLTIL